ncbi:MAG TPA: hypothetical protein VMF89_16615 [Polyangiales bacterium]|nr:hypothetical protein [Polyangiales bacterium]
MSPTRVLLMALVSCTLASACTSAKCGTPERACAIAAADGGTRDGASSDAAYSGGSGGAGAGGAGEPGSAGSSAGESGSAGAGAQASTDTLQLIGVGSFGLRARSDDGADWSYCGNARQGDDHTPDLLRAVAYGDGVFVAVGGDQNGRVMRSLDGEHWEEDVHPLDACPDETYPSSCTNWMGAVAYLSLPRVWLAGGGNGATMRSMDGGRTWQGLHKGFPEKHIRSMLAGGGLFMASTDGGDVYVTRDHGDSWTGGNVWSGAGFLRVLYGFTYFIAYSEAGDACFVSDNLGASWQPCATEAQGGTAYLFDGKQWIAAQGDHYATSTNTRDWTKLAAPMPEQLLFDGTTYFGRSEGTIYRATAPDAFEVVATQVPGFRAWTLGRVLNKNLPITSPAACVDRR